MKLGLQSMVSSSSVFKSVISLLLNPLFLGGFFFQTVCVIYWLFLLKSNKLSIMFPIATSLAFASVIVLSSLYLNEEISLRVIGGAAIILIGIFVVSGGN
jgi:uncharacterized membrane protein